MENSIYNELLCREFGVDVSVIKILESGENTKQELRSLEKISDSFGKIVVTKSYAKP